MRKLLVLSVRYCYKRCGMKKRKIRSCLTLELRRDVSERSEERNKKKKCEKNTSSA